MRKYKGGVDLDSDWKFVSDLGKIDGVVWKLFSKPQDSGWLTLKIAADGMVPTKANYWLAWSGSRLGRTKDKQLLEEGRPVLYENLMTELEDF